MYTVIFQANKTFQPDAGFVDLNLEAQTRAQNASRDQELAELRQALTAMVDTLRGMGQDSFSAIVDGEKVL